MFKSATIVARGVDSSAYHAAKAERGSEEFVVSPSSLKEFAHCPRRWIDGYVAPESEAKSYGSLLDLLVLTPELFDKQYAVRPQTYPDSKNGEAKPWNNNSAFCKEWNQAIEELGREPIKREDVVEAQVALAKLRKDRNISEYLDASDKQVHVTAEWHDHATDLVIPVQCLMDAVPRRDSPYWRSAGDLKTTRAALPAAWCKWSSQRMYHLQAAFDLDLLNAAEKRDEGDERDEWYFLVQENFAPWQTAGYILSAAKINCGRVMYQNFLARYAKCLKTGVWPDYAGNADPNKVVAGWIVDDVSPWDEAVAMNTIPPIEEPAPEPEEETDLIP